MPALDKVRLDEVLHVATLDVDEQETVVAAATAVEIAIKVFEVLKVIVVRVGHPFFCAIRDQVTGDILFGGIIRDPQG